MSTATVYPGALGLLVSVLAATQVAAFLARRLRSNVETGGSHALLQFGIMAAAVTIGSALILAALGALSAVGFLVLHVSLAAASLAWDFAASPLVPRSGWGRPSLTAELAVVGAGVRRLWRSERALSCVLGVLLLSFAVAAVGTAPLNPDSNAYRLPRIALWLQHGRLDRLGGGDPRLDYMAWNADLVMLWLVAFFRTGYPLVQVVSWSGGVLCCTATFALARLAGLRERLALLATLGLLALPNVATQAFTSQTDLFTAGLSTASLGCGLRALRRWREDRGGARSDARFAGLALGLAVGAKGTVFYLVPGLVLTVILAGAVWRVTSGSFVRMASVALAWAVPFAAPPYVRNVVLFGHPLAPRAERERVHARPLGSRVAFAAANAAGLGWQLFDPNANLPLLREGLRPAFRRGEAALRRQAEERPHYAGFGAAFALWGRPVLDERRLHEDYASAGLLVPILAVAGWLAVLRRRDPPDGVEVWLLHALAVTTLAFALALVLLQAFTPHKFRYFVAVGPFLAILAAAAVRGCGRGAKSASYGFAALFATMAGTVFCTSRSHGLPALLHPDAVAGAREQTLRERAVDALPVAGRLGLALPFNSRLAPFLRRPGERTATLLGADELSRGGGFEGWLREMKLAGLVVDLDAVQQPPGRVRASWAAPDAAVALLQPGEPATSGLCADGTGLGLDGRISATARFRTYLVPGGELDLTLQNLGGGARRVEITSGRETRTESLAPLEARGLRIRVAPADDVSLRVSPDQSEGGVRLGLPAGLGCATGPRTRFVRAARQAGL